MILKYAGPRLLQDKRYVQHTAHHGQDDTARNHFIPWCFHCWLLKETVCNKRFTDCSTILLAESTDVPPSTCSWASYPNFGHSCGCPSPCFANPYVCCSKAQTPEQSKALFHIIWYVWNCMKLNQRISFKALFSGSKACGHTSTCPNWLVQPSGVHTLPHWSGMPIASAALFQAAAMSLTKEILMWDHSQFLPFVIFLLLVKIVSRGFELT